MVGRIGVLCGLTLVMSGLMGEASYAVTCPATTDEEWAELVASSPQQATFIRTAQDWEDFKAGARFLGHPLNGLSSQALADFSASLWIVDGGVVTMNAGLLQQSLSQSAYANVLSAFGVSTELAQDHWDYICYSRASCLVFPGWLCFSTC